eukprot:354588-Chlamydomonas_euryale.AAC.4
MARWQRTRLHCAMAAHTCNLSLQRRRCCPRGGRAGATAWRPAPCPARTAAAVPQTPSATTCRSQRAAAQRRPRQCLRTVP